MISKAQKFLEELEPMAMAPEPDPNFLRLRANHRSGVRCLDCGRMLSKVHALPAIRTCPSEGCGSRYQITRHPDKGLGVRKL